MAKKFPDSSEPPHHSFLDRDKTIERLRKRANSTQLEAWARVHSLPADLDAWKNSDLVGYCMAINVDAIYVPMPDDKGKGVGSILAGMTEDIHKLDTAYTSILQRLADLEATAGWKPQPPSGPTIPTPPKSGSSFTPSTVLEVKAIAEEVKRALRSDFFDSVSTITKLLDTNNKSLADVKGWMTATAKSMPRDVIRDIATEATKLMTPIVHHIKIGDTEPREIKGLFHPVFGKCLSLAANGITVMMIGPGGSGKSTIAEQMAKAMGLRYATVSCTAGLSESVFTGRLLPVGEGGRFEFVSTEFIRCFEEGGLFFLDEVDAADPNALLIFNQAMAQGHLSLPNRVAQPLAERHPNFVMVAAANTYGHGIDRQYVGRNQLDESTLDRFRAGQVTMTYDQQLEIALCPDEKLRQRVWAIRKEVEKQKLRTIVSTRFLKDGYKLLRAGWEQHYVLGQLVAGWSKDMISKAGIGETEYADIATDQKAMEKIRAGLAQFNAALNNLSAAAKNA